ncbi:hypothetical protein ES705_14135 [subsurface metagenome]
MLRRKRACERFPRTKFRRASLNIKREIFNVRNLFVYNNSRARRYEKEFSNDRPQLEKKSYRILRTRSKIKRIEIRRLQRINNCSLTKFK